MITRANILIKDLKLLPHPEGGFYREIFRSEALVQPLDGREKRNALTAIYFLLRKGEHSKWHQVLSDEIWCYLEGDPLELLFFDETSNTLKSIKLGQYFKNKTEPIYVIKAGIWQAARSKGEYTLVGCYVAPGFDFKDFKLASDSQNVANLIRKKGKKAASFL